MTFDSFPLWDAIINYDLKEIINRAVAYGIIIAIFLSVVFVFYGGISLILSGGQEDKIKQAVSTIRQALIGLVISFLAVVFVATLGKAFGLEDVVGYIDLKEVYHIVQTIGQGQGTPAL